jgi:hypothetical protein
VFIITNNAYRHSNKLNLTAAGENRILLHESLLAIRKAHGLKKSMASFANGK